MPVQDQNLVYAEHFHLEFLEQRLDEIQQDTLLSISFEVDFYTLNSLIGTVKDYTVQWFEQGKDI